MDVEYCLTCDRSLGDSQGVYCSEICREQDELANPNAVKFIPSTDINRRLDARPSQKRTTSGSSNNKSAQATRPYTRVSTTTSSAITPALDVPSPVRTEITGFDAFAWSFPATSQRPRIPAPDGGQWLGNDRGAIMCWARSVSQSQEACWDPVDLDAYLPPSSVPVTAADRSAPQVARLQNQIRPLAMSACTPAPPTLSISNDHRPYFGSQRPDHHHPYTTFSGPKSSQDDSGTSLVTSILTGDDDVYDDDNVDDIRTALTSVSESHQEEEGGIRALSFLSQQMKHWMVPTSLPKTKFTDFATRPESPVEENVPSHTPRRPLLHDVSNSAHLVHEGARRISHQRHRSTPMDAFVSIQPPAPFGPNARGDHRYNEAIVLSSSLSSSIGSGEVREIPVTRGRERRHSDYPLRHQTQRYDYGSRSPVLDIAFNVGGSGRSPCSPTLFVGLGSSTMRRSRHFRGRSCGRTTPITAIAAATIRPPAVRP